MAHHLRVPALLRLQLGLRLGLRLRLRRRLRLPPQQPHIKGRADASDSAAVVAIGGRF